MTPPGEGPGAVDEGPGAGRDGPLTITPARPGDVPLVLAFIRALATYEKLEHEVEADEATLRESLFGARPAAEVAIARAGREPAGFAVFYTHFSTFVGRPGLYLEDLFVAPEFRRRGIGTALFLHLVALARERRCGRMEWAALDWNDTAVGFYRGLGAVPLEGWTTFRLSGEALDRAGRDGAG